VIERLNQQEPPKPGHDWNKGGAMEALAKKLNGYDEKEKTSEKEYYGELTQN
jgi:hypothetical protein